MLERLPRLARALQPLWPAWIWRSGQVPAPAQCGDKPVPGPLPATEDLPARGLQLAPGACFEHVQATQIVLGAGPVDEPVIPQDLQRWQPPVGARPWAQRGWQIGHSLDIAAAQRVPCALYVRGHLQVQRHCLIVGDLKARQTLRLGPGCHVHGQLLSEGDMHIGPGCCIQGAVSAQGRLHLAPGVVIGSVQHPVSVSADVIEVVGPVRVHGVVRARVQGSIALPSGRDIHLVSHPQAKDTA